MGDKCSCYVNIKFNVTINQVDVSVIREQLWSSDRIILLHQLQTTLTLQAEITTMANMTLTDTIFSMYANKRGGLYTEFLAPKRLGN